MKIPTREHLTQLNRRTGEDREIGILGNSCHSFNPPKNSLKAATAGVMETEITNYLSPKSQSSQELCICQGHVHDIPRDSPGVPADLILQRK